MPITVSLITVCYNAGATIERCLRSVFAQDYPYLEYIVVDGASTDGTQKILRQNAHRITRIISEPDKGLYDALNKGISKAGGDVVGLVHADDLLAHERVISDVARLFAENGTDAVYGDLDFYSASGKVVRKWVSGNYRRGKFRRGWMPPHPTFYLRKEYYDRYGLYDPAYGSAADYELMLRMLYTHRLNATYLPEVFVHMQTGGLSNHSLTNRLKANFYDHKALRFHRVPFAFLAVLLKVMQKIKQFRQPNFFAG